MTRGSNASSAAHGSCGHLSQGEIALAAHRGDDQISPVSPSSPVSIPRRTMLRAVAGFLAQAGMWSVPLSLPMRAFADTPSTLDSAGFLALSHALTGHQGLAQQTSDKIFAWLRADDPTFSKAAASLTVLSRSTASPERLLSAATPLGLGAAALSIVSAWYTGTVGLGPTGHLVAYQQALMYATVSDGLTVPTYCSNGPLWWTAPVPPIGVAPPRAVIEAPPPANRHQ